MKKLVLSLTAICAAVSLNAQNIWSENFDQILTGGTTDFTVADLDGDTEVFGFYDFTTSTATWLNPLAASAGSASWIAAGALTPDNLLISPAIDLSGVTGPIVASWDASTVEITADGFYPEHYAMYAFASTADIATIASATPLFEETLSAGEQIFSEQVDISSFAGGDVILVIRHYDCTDMNLFVVDNFSVDQGSVSITENTITAKVYPNPANDVLNVTTTGKADRISILSLDGKVVSTQEMNGTSTTVNVADLNSGAYIYEVTSADGSAVRNTFMKK